MRPPPASGGYLTGMTALDLSWTASMRPPPASGGYEEQQIRTLRFHLASMRPPPASGGYAREFIMAYLEVPCFNEAAARERRIRRSRNASYAKGSRTCLREPRPDNNPIVPLCVQSQPATSVTSYFQRTFCKASGPGGIWHHMASRQQAAVQTITTSRLTGDTFRFPSETIRGSSHSAVPTSMITI